VLEDVAEVLAVTVHKDAAVVADVLHVPATEMRIEGLTTEMCGRRRSVCTKV
jgi:hypothetical protein